MPLPIATTSLGFSRFQEVERGRTVRQRDCLAGQDGTRRARPQPRGPSPTAISPAGPEPEEPESRAACTGVLVAGPRGVADSAMWPRTANPAPGPGPGARGVERRRTTRGSRCRRRSDDRHPVRPWSTSIHQPAARDRAEARCAEIASRLSPSSRARPPPPARRHVMRAMQLQVYGRGTSGVSSVELGRPRMIQPHVRRPDTAPDPPRRRSRPRPGCGPAMARTRGSPGVPDRRAVHGERLGRLALGPRHWTRPPTPRRRVPDVGPRRRAARCGRG